MKHPIRNHINTSLEEAGPDTAVTETRVAIPILLNNMDTLIRALNPHLAMIILIMLWISVLPTMMRMDPEDEAEVEAEEKGTGVKMGILVALAQTGKDQEGTLAHTVGTTKAHGPLTQENIPWMDLMVLTGEEGWTGLWNKPTKTRMPK